MRIIEFIEKANFINLIDKEDLYYRYSSVMDNVTLSDLLYLHYYEILNEDFYSIILSTFKRYSDLNINFVITNSTTYKEPKLTLHCNYVKGDEDNYYLKLNKVEFVNFISPFMNLNYIKNIKDFCPVINTDLDFIASKLINNNLYIQYEDNFIIPIKIQMSGNINNDTPNLLTMDCYGFLLDTNKSNTLLKISNLS